MEEESSRTVPPEDPRVRLAAERTMLAWVRTSLALMGFGFVVARFGLFMREIAEASHAPQPASSGWSLWVGTTLVLLGVAAALISSLNHYRMLRRLDRGEPFRAPDWSAAIVIAVILAVLGTGMAAYLVLLRH